jgi:hypothetical protein
MATKTKDLAADRLFPELPEELSEMSDADLEALLREHKAAAKLIKDRDEDFCDGLNAQQIVDQAKVGKEQTAVLLAEIETRKEGEQEFLAQIAELTGDILGPEASETDDGGEGDGDGDDGGEGDGGDAEAALASEEDETEAETPAEVEETDEEEKPTEVVAAGKPALRKPPSPSAERRATAVAQGTPLVAAAGLQEVRAGLIFDRKTFARAVKTTAERRGKPTKSTSGVEERILIASANFPFPDDRQLRAGDLEGNQAKIAAVIPNYIPGVGQLSGEALVASGGLCAPLTPLYTMPNFASQARPVRDSLPSFQADRGGVNVPAASYIGDIDTAITVITEDEDALGGTFATKSCQDLDCPAYTDVPVTIISHCREYGNLNAMAWPEKIAHENDLTMAAHSRTAETYLLERIKLLSIATTQGNLGSIMNAYASLVHAIQKATAHIRYVLRMDRNARFRVILPAWIPDLLSADAALAQFDRYQAEAALIAALQALGVSITWHLDSVANESAVTDFAAEVEASSLNDFPNTVEYAVYAEGAFLHVDSGSLELGLVRDSTLNSTNDFQLFGETFENVALLGPAQSAYWITQNICPNGVFPSLGTAPTCA